MLGIIKCACSYQTELPLPLPWFRLPHLQNESSTRAANLSLSPLVNRSLKGQMGLLGPVLTQKLFLLP